MDGASQAPPWQFDASNAAFFAAVGLTIAWTVGSLIRSEVFWRKRNAPGRPADANAGWAIREMQQREGDRFIARTRTDRRRPHPAQEVEVNFATQRVAFRGFVFVTSFVGNKPTRERALPFTDIVGGRMWTTNSHVGLSLRTTAGPVTVSDTVQPFHPLKAVLLDVVEVNRKNPIAFADALAREPRIKTPWYGWLFFAVALAGVIGLVAFFLIHPA